MYDVQGLRVGANILDLTNTCGTSLLDWRNGECNLYLNNLECDWDGGDCVVDGYSEPSLGLETAFVIKIERGGGTTRALRC